MLNMQTFSAAEMSWERVAVNLLQSCFPLAKRLWQSRPKEKGMVTLEELPELGCAREATILSTVTRWDENDKRR